jgi:hypothetical protein
MAYAASKEVDPIARETLERDAEPCAEAWQCPIKGYPLQETTDHLPPTCHTALRAAEALTGASDFTTCPLAYARLPWVQETSAIYARLKDGIPLSDQVGAPSQVLLEALDCVREGVKAREAYEIEQIRQKQKRPEEDT